MCLDLKPILFSKKKESSFVKSVEQSDNTIKVDYQEGGSRLFSTNGIEQITTQDLGNGSFQHTFYSNLPLVRASEIEQITNQVHSMIYSYLNTDPDHKYDFLKTAIINRIVYQLQQAREQPSFQIQHPLISLTQAEQAQLNRLTPRIMINPFLEAATTSNQEFGVFVSPPREEFFANHFPIIRIPEHQVLSIKDPVEIELEKTKSNCHHEWNCPALDRINEAFYQTRNDRFLGSYHTKATDKIREIIFDSLFPKSEFYTERAWNLILKFQDFDFPIEQSNHEIIYL